MDEYFRDLRSVPIFTPPPDFWDTATRQLYMDMFAKHGTCDPEALAIADASTGRRFGRYLRPWRASISRPFKISPFSVQDGVTAFYVPSTNADTSLLLETSTRGADNRRIEHKIRWPNISVPNTSFSLTDLLSQEKRHLSNGLSRERETSPTNQLMQPEHEGVVVIGSQEYVRLEYFTPFWPSGQVAMLHFRDTYTIYFECILMASYSAFHESGVHRTHVLGNSVPSNVVLDLQWHRLSKITYNECASTDHDSEIERQLSLIAHDPLDEPPVWNFIR